MEFVTQTTTAGSVFERAKRDFNVGDFASALMRAQEADKLACSQARVTHDSAVSKPIYSIIVVTYRDIPDVYEAFSRLDKYSRSPDYEIIVVNNGNPAGFAIAKTFFTHFKWIEVGFNYRCSGARNLGAQAARGDFLIFVDDDGYVADCAIENLIEIIEKYRAGLSGAASFQSRRLGLPDRNMIWEKMSLSAGQMQSVYLFVGGMNISNMVVSIHF